MRCLSLNRLALAVQPVLVPGEVVHLRISREGKDNGQRVGAATVAHGIAVSAYELALAYAHEREQFGRPIAEFQGIQWMLADMSIQLSAAQALIYGAAARAGECLNRASAQKNQ